MESEMLSEMPALVRARARARARVNVRTLNLT